MTLQKEDINKEENLDVSQSIKGLHFIYEFHPESVRKIPFRVKLRMPTIITWSI
jgi:hypothetical protein